jgi:hypothetical protein
LLICLFVSDNPFYIDLIEFRPPRNATSTSIQVYHSSRPFPSQRSMSLSHCLVYRINAQWMSDTAKWPNKRTNELENQQMIDFAAWTTTKKQRCRSIHESK